MPQCAKIGHGCCKKAVAVKNNKVQFFYFKKSFFKKPPDGCPQGRSSCFEWGCC